MRKYLAGVIAALMVILITGYTNINKKSSANYYRFHYSFCSYSQATVQNETVGYWGFGVLVSGPSMFSEACTGDNEKACEIIVPEASTLSTVNGRRLKSIEAGDAPSTDLVSIVSRRGDNDSTKYIVAGGINIFDLMNTALAPSP